MIVPFILLHLLCGTISYAISYGKWQIGGSIPLPNHMMAIGYDAINDTIWLLGGDGQTSKQLVAFDIVTQTFVLNQTRLSHDVWGNQYFTQIGNILWMINAVRSPYVTQTFSIFNVITSQFTYHYNNIAIPVNTREYACLASTTDNDHKSYLFVVGGQDANYAALYLTQIFNISSNTWLTNAPSMNTNRASFSCIVHNDKLYSIGGHHSIAPYYLDSIEMLDVSNTNLHTFARTWRYIDSLNVPRERTNAVRYMDKVLVIGGAPSGNGGGSSNGIHVIDTVTDTVRFHCESLVTPVHHSAPVVVNGTLFAFGGYQYGSGTNNNWQYTVLPINQSTLRNHTSTQEPAWFPTNSPTVLLLTADLSEDPGETVSFVTHIAGSMGRVGVIITIIVSCIVCVNVLLCILTGKTKPEHIVHETNNDTRGAVHEPRQQSPDTSISLPESTVVHTDIEASVSIPMEGMATIMEEKGEHERDDSEQLYDLDERPTDDGDVSELKSWLTAHGFAHYFHNFVLFGYYTLDAVKAIDNAQGLADIGIRHNASQRLLMSLIKAQLCNPAMSDGECCNA
eukprot:921635_1